MAATDQQITEILQRKNLGEILQRQGLSGGSICRVERLRLASGASLILKQLGQAPPDSFKSEALGLSALQQADALRIPSVIHCDDDFLLLEDLGQGQPAQNYWTQLGEGLALMHSEAKPRFGFETDNYCGSTRQCNTLSIDGFEFFAKYRLLNLCAEAQQRGLLRPEDSSAIEYIAARLQDWVPDAPAVLLHGDLWSGNVHCDAAGNPALIDPATYWGWAEAELAMTLLFGGFSEGFYESYMANSDFDAGWKERADLYNLYHLLNHLLLFGESYLSRIRDITCRYSSK